MAEFKNTKNASLTFDEFMAIEQKELEPSLSGGQDPPAFMKNLLKY